MKQEQEYSHTQPQLQPSFFAGKDICWDLSSCSDSEDSKGRAESTAGHKEAGLSSQDQPAPG